MAKKKDAKKSDAAPQPTVARKGPNPTRRCGKAAKKNPKSNPASNGGKFGYSSKRIAALAAERGGDIDGVLLVLKTQVEHKELARCRRPRVGKPTGQNYKMETIKQPPRLLAQEARDARKRATERLAEEKRRLENEIKRTRTANASRLAEVAGAVQAAP